MRATNGKRNCPSLFRTHHELLLISAAHRTVHGGKKNERIKLLITRRHFKAPSERIKPDPGAVRDGKMGKDFQAIKRELVEGGRMSGLGHAMRMLNHEPEIPP